MSQKKNKQIRYNARVAEKAALEAIKKNKGILAGSLRNKLLSGLMLVLIAAAMISCEMGQEYEPGNNPNTEEPTNPGNPQTGPKNHYTDYENFNPADYPILNESGKPDSAIADLKDIIWLMYAEREDIRDWTANYIKTNNIKTILSSGQGFHAWIFPSQLDRLYLNTDSFESMFGDIYNEYDDNYKAAMREQIYGYITHETMHLVQYKSGAFNLMTGMRPDICAATDMLIEFLAWFYTSGRYPGAIITANMKDAVEIQSKYMILSTDPWEYENARAKDPSLPPFIHSAPWFNNEVSHYAQHAFTSALVHESAMTAPLRQASQEDILKVARAMLACRDPKMAGVTDEALLTVCEALRDVATGNSKYLRFESYNGARQESFDNFQALIAQWDAMAPARSVVQTRSVSPASSMELAAAQTKSAIDWKSTALAWNGKKR